MGTKGSCPDCGRNCYLVPDYCILCAWRRNEALRAGFVPSGVLQTCPLCSRSVQFLVRGRCGACDQTIRTALTRKGWVTRHKRGYVHPAKRKTA